MLTPEALTQVHADESRRKDSFGRRFPLDEALALIRRAKTIRIWWVGFSRETADEHSSPTGRYLKVNKAEVLRALARDKGTPQGIATVYVDDFDNYTIWIGP